MMGNDLFSVSRLFFCGADVYMLYRFFSAIFQEKRKGKKCIIFSLIVILLIFFENSIGSVTLNFLTVPIFYYIFVILSFNISISNGIAYTIIFFAFMGGKEVLFELLYRLLSENLPFYIPPWFTSGGIYFLMIEYLVTFLFLLYIERHIRKLNIGNNNNFSWYLLIVPILTLIISTSFLYIDFPKSVIIQVFICVGDFLLFFSNVVIFIILEKYADILDMIKYTELYTIKRNMENEHFQNILKINEQYRCYMHDINAYFNSFRMLALNNENKKIVEIIDELKGEIQEKTNNLIYSGNPVLNAILSERATRAEEEKINLSIFVEKFLKIDFISDSDMISMFGNLLDNAIEAAVKCSLKNRRVNVKIFMGTNYFLIFHIENSYAMAAKKEGTRLLSTKADSSHHGLGIGIVRTLAEKYGGTLNLEEKENLFITTLTISTCIKEQSANFGT